MRKGNLRLTSQNDTIMEVSYSSESTPEFAYAERSRFSSVFDSHYGEYEAQIKAPERVGMVTSFITISDDGNDRRNLTAIRFMPNSVRAETGMPSKAAPSWLFQRSTDLLWLMLTALRIVNQ